MILGSTILLGSCLEISNSKVSAPEEFDKETSIMTKRGMYNIKEFENRIEATPTIPLYHKIVDDKKDGYLDKQTRGFATKFETAEDLEKEFYSKEIYPKIKSTY